MSQLLYRFRHAHHVAAPLSAQVCAVAALIFWIIIKSYKSSPKHKTLAKPLKCFSNVSAKILQKMLHRAQFCLTYPTVNFILTPILNIYFFQFNASLACLGNRTPGKALMTAIKYWGLTTTTGDGRRRLRSLCIAQRKTWPYKLAEILSQCFACTAIKQNTFFYLDPKRMVNQAKVGRRPGPASEQPWVGHCCRLRQLGRRTVVTSRCVAWLQQCSAGRPAQSVRIRAQYTVYS